MRPAPVAAGAAAAGAGCRQGGAAPAARASSGGARRRVRGSLTAQSCLRSPAASAAPWRCHNSSQTLTEQERAAGTQRVTRIHLCASTSLCKQRAARTPAQARVRSERTSHTCCCKTPAQPPARGQRAGCLARVGPALHGLARAAARDALRVRRLPWRGQRLRAAPHECVHLRARGRRRLCRAQQPHYSNVAPPRTWPLLRVIHTTLLL